MAFLKLTQIDSFTNLKISTSFEVNSIFLMSPFREDRDF